MPKRMPGEDGEQKIKRNVDLREFVQSMRESSPETPEERAERERQYRLTPLYVYYAPNFWRDPVVRGSYTKSGGVKGYLTQVLRNEIEPYWKQHGTIQGLEGSIRDLDELQVPISEEKLRELFSSWKEQSPE
jgi:hypothetical protein